MDAERKGDFMKIEKVNDNQIRCTLTREDLASRELKISELAYGTEKAKNLLTYSNYSLTEIANYLAFSSQSHFIQIFQKYGGTTPRKYRELHFRNNWEDMFT